MLYAFHAHISVICNAPVDSLADHHSAGGGNGILTDIKAGLHHFY